MSTPPFSRRTLLRGTMAAGVAAAFVPLTVRPVFAAQPSAVAIANGDVVYRSGAYLCRKSYDGSSNGFALSASATSNVAFAPDGSRFACVNDGGDNSAHGGIWTRRPDFSDPVHLTQASEDTDVAFSSQGRFVYFSRNGKIMSVTADGAWLRTDVIAYPEPNPFVDRHPNIVAGRNLIFDRCVSGGAPGIYVYQSPGVATQLIPNAKCGVYSPDGTKIAYLTSNAAYEGLELWVADADGQNAARLGSRSNLDAPSWAPDGKSIVFTQVPTLWPYPELTKITLDGAASHIDTGGHGSVQPLTSDRNTIVRTWGPIALDTAIAISQFNWADHDAPTVPDPASRLKAGAVVLGRGDLFYDALAGSALAANKDAPLLITPPDTLYGPAQAELQRVLAPGGKVYLLGGEAAISRTIENQIKDLNYVVHRCGGADMFDTAVKINQQITRHPASRRSSSSPPAPSSTMLLPQARPPARTTTPSWSSPTATGCPPTPLAISTPSIPSAS